jgi:hypothetical protein
MVETAHLRDILGPGPYDYVSVNRNVLREYDIDHTVIIISLANAFDKAVDQTMEDVLGTMKSNWWLGPIAFMRKPSGQSKTYEDITAGDYRIAANYVAKFTAPGVFPWDNSVEVTKGVRINCQGDRKTMGIFNQVDVAQKHPVFKAANCPQIAKLIGLEILIFKYTPTTYSWGRDRTTID